MQKKLLCAAVLAAVIPCAHAQDMTWHFSWQGFADGVTGVFDPDQVLTGTFRGRELDNDGILTTRELTYFEIHGDHVYLDPVDGGCVASTSWFLRCSIDSFAFALTGGLHFSVGYRGSDELNRSWSGSFVSGAYFSTYYENNGRELVERHLWTPATDYWISPTPVPEPSAALLLPAGLALVWAARRRKI